jgi:hypothetical protein
MSKQQPLQVILSLLPSLSANDRKTLRRKLEMAEPSACERNGHSLKEFYRGGGLFTTPDTYFVCSKCGIQVKPK